ERSYGPSPTSPVSRGPSANPMPCAFAFSVVDSAPASRASAHACASSRMLDDRLRSGVPGIRPRLRFVSLAGSLQNRILGVTNTIPPPEQQEPHDVADRVARQPL